MDPKKIDKIIKHIRSLREEMTLGGGNIAGTSQAKDDPPVFRKKRRTVAKGGVGSRRLWLIDLSNKSNGRRN